MKVYDLSHLIHSDMTVYPGDPSVALKEALTHDKDYCHVDILQLNSHTGTHIDAPFHFFQDGKKISEYPVHRFIGAGVFIDVKECKCNQILTKELFECYDKQYKIGGMVVIRTGWYQYFGDEIYFQHPFISKEAAQYLASKQVGLVAVDFLSVDHTNNPDWKAHEIFLRNDILIVENLNQLDQLQDGIEYEYSFLPLKLGGSDGSPIRAIAKEIVE